MDSERKNYRLSKGCIDFLKEIQLKKGLKSETAALEQIVREYKEQQKQEQFISILLHRMDEHYKNLFTRIRLASNGADKNSQIVLEVVNSILVDREIYHATPTDLLKSEVLEQAELTVDARISAYRQRKLESKKKKSGTNRPRNERRVNI